MPADVIKAGADVRPCPECGATFTTLKQRAQHANSHWGLSSGQIRPEQLQGEARKRFIDLAPGVLDE